MNSSQLRTYRRKVTGGLRLVRTKAAFYGETRTPAEAWRLAWYDRPGRSGERSLDRVGRPDLVRRRGTTDLDMFMHVIPGSGYEFPFEIATPSWIVDAGANVGYASVWLAERHPNATIVAIEPERANFALLQRNVAHLDNVRCVHAALCPTDGTVELADPKMGSSAFQVKFRDGDDRIGIEVPAVSLPTLMAEHGIDRIGLLKVDIEGGELPLFDASDLWIERVDAIAIELHDRFLPGCTEVFDRATAAFGRRGERGEDTFVAR